MKFQLAEMTTIEAQEAFERTDLVILPVGSTEAHGPHNPVFTDSNAASELARRVGEKMNGMAIVAPLLPYGFCPYHMKFSGTITLQQETLFAVLRDICNSLVHWGARRILFLTGHGGNLAAISTIANELYDKEVLCSFPAWYAASVAGTIEERWAHVDHGGFKETMVNMVVMPDAVRMDLYTPANIGYQMTDKLKVSYDGAEFQGAQIPVYFPTKVAWPYGFIESPVLPASEATPEEGERMLDSIAQLFAGFLDEFRKTPFPSNI